MKSIRKTKSHKHQKLWKMFGCSKKFTHKRNIKGGSCPNADVNLAYTGTPTNCSIVQPQLAYTGKGGKRRRRGSCGGATCAMHGGGTDGVPFPLPGNSWTYKNWPGFTNDVDATQYSLNQYSLNHQYDVSERLQYYFDEFAFDIFELDISLGIQFSFFAILIFLIHLFFLWFFLYILQLQFYVSRRKPSFLLYRQDIIFKYQFYL